MQSVMLNLQLILAQTPQERRLTILYVSLFGFLCLMLFIDTREGKKLVGGNKTLAKIVAFMLVLSLVVLVILYFVL